MALKAVVSSLEEVDENFRSLYQESGGQFVLALDGVESHPSATALANALTRQKEERKAAEERRMALEETMKQFDGLDPEAARKALDRVNEMEDKKMMDQGEFEKLLENKTAAMRADFEKQQLAKEELLAKATESTQMLDSRLREVTIHSALKDAATKLGVRSSALPDVVARSNGIWNLDDEGQPVAVDPDGTRMIGKDSNPMQITEWVEGLAASAPHLFEPNSGGGAKGSGPGSSGGRKVVSTADAGHFLEDIASGKAVVG
jgi:hypothetical protein